MDRQRVREWEAQCIEEQPPACTATCPVHVDVRGLIESVRKEDFAGGFSLLSRSVPFPGIISHICDHPCESACKRREAGDPIAIRALEQSCTDFAYKAIEHSFLSRKNQKIAIIGAGLSGLTAAVDLAIKGYKVVVFEAKARVLERIFALDEQVIPRSLICADLAILEKVGIEIRSKAWVSSGLCNELADDFDAVYMGSGPEPLDPGAGVSLRPDGRIAIDSTTFATSHPKIFSGGTQRYAPAPFSPITSLQDGKYAAVSIDRFLQGASLTANRDNQGSYTSRLYVSLRDASTSERTPQQNPVLGYTRESAKREAERCLPCQCLECVRVCEYLSHYMSYPKRYVREIYNNDSIVLGNRPSNRMINTCALCGLCEAVCPEKLNMGEVCLEARKSMVLRSKMPPSAHEFALRDMAFSTSESFVLKRHQPGHSSSAALFFPGCQLSGSSPHHVKHAYDYLQRHVEGGVGLMLGCCGAPAHWSGEEALFQKVLSEVRNDWDRLGRPRLITACATCYRTFKDHLPELPVESLWEVFDRRDIDDASPQQVSGPLAIHDPCTTRNEEGVQAAVRNVLRKLGADIIELNPRGLSTCCGFGGLMQFANPEVADKLVNRRIHDSETDYVTYCAMCRDNFARRGKRALHVLDLVFASDDTDPAARPDCGFSVRQENRARLKNQLLRELWREPVVIEEQKLNLIVSPEVMERLEKRMILLDDVRKVIAHAEKTGQKIWNADRGRFIACHRPASVTYWVEYTVQQTGIVVLSAYSHRMEVA